MIEDAWIVAQQEWRTIRRSLMPSASDIATLVMVLALFGIVLPFGMTRGWLGRAGMHFLWFWLVWLIVAGPVSDSFAGERERHTLEALFATRLPGAAILLGKIGAIAAFGSTLTLVAILTSYLIARIANASVAAAAFRFDSLIAAAALTPIVALLASSTGALLSLNARSARQTHQATILIVPVVAVIAAVASLVLQSVAPAMLQNLDQVLQRLLALPQYWLFVTAILLILTALAYVVAASRLQKCRVLPR